MTARAARAMKFLSRVIKSSHLARLKSDMLRDNRGWGRSMFGVGMTKGALIQLTENSLLNLGPSTS